MGQTEAKEEESGRNIYWRDITPGTPIYALHFAWVAGDGAEAAGVYWHGTEPCEAQRWLSERQEPPVWATTPEAWQARRGVHAPWIAEVSGMQLAGMSRRARAAYDKQRDAQWEASGACKARWAAALLHAYRRGAFTLRDPEVTSAAKSAVVQAQLRNERELRERCMREASDANRYTSAAWLRPGLRVYCLMGGRYVTLTKVNRLTAWYVDADAPGPGLREHRAQVGALQWLSYDDMAQFVDAALAQQEGS